MSAKRKPKKKADAKLRRSFACSEAEWAILLRIAEAEESSVSRVLRRVIRSLETPKV